MHLIAPGDEAKFSRLLNEAESRLQETAKWNWTKAEAELPVEDGYVYLDPELYDSLLGVILDDGARVIRPREIEFAPNFGQRSVAGEAGSGVVIDMGKVTVTIDDVEVKRRKYKVADVVQTPTADCLLHLAHVTLTGMDDYLACPSARAMKLAMFACLYEEANDLERSKSFWAEAYQALSEDEATKRGASRGSISVQPFGDGVDTISPIH